MAGTVEKYLDQLLAIYWLRPETALWRTFDCLLMEKYASICGEAIDLGCGDGILSFVMAGGRIRNYDVFMDVGELAGYNGGSDIHNHCTGIGIDADPSGVRYSYEWGVDAKAGLIRKAAKLAAFYRRNAVLDLNEALPCGDARFDCAFSNVLYWLDDPHRTLSCWHRGLKAGGKLFLFVPNSTFKDKAPLYFRAPHTGKGAYFNYFDRGYGALIHHCYDNATWSDLFEKNGFETVGHHLYLTDPVISVWNVGTRPIAPPLIGMARMLGPRQREEAKAEWVRYFSGFFRPMIEGEFERRVDEKDAAFHFFVLEKK